MCRETNGSSDENAEPSERGSTCLDSQNFDGRGCARFDTELLKNVLQLLLHRAGAGSENGTQDTGTFAFYIIGPKQIVLMGTDQGVTGDAIFYMQF